MDEIKVTIKHEDQAEIMRQVLDCEVCTHFTEKKPYYILLFIEVMDEVFNKIGELSRMQQVADIMKGENNDK